MQGRGQNPVFHMEIQLLQHHLLRRQIELFWQTLSKSKCTGKDKTITGLGLKYTRNSTGKGSSSHCDTGLNALGYFWD